MKDRNCSARRTSRLRRASIALFLAGGIGLPTSATADGPHGDPWSSYGHSHRPTKAADRNFVFRALDSFAGGIEKLLRLDDHCTSCDEIGCDDACDAAMMQELLLPEGELVPMPEMQQWEVQPYVEQRLMPAPDSGGQQAPSSPNSGIEQGTPQSPSSPPVEQPAAPRQGDDSIFEGLGDPFEDDQASKAPGRKSVIRRSSFGGSAAKAMQVQRISSRRRSR